MSDAKLLQVKGLKKYFPLKRTSLLNPPQSIYAVDGVDIDLMPGEILGLVGESGCGKSTLGRAILQLIKPTAGSIFFQGRDVSGVKGAALKKLRSKMQIIFQDPYSSLNPRITVKSIIGDALRAHGLARGGELEDRVVEMLDRVGIHREKINAYPHEFSGGQRQRIGIARALVLHPKLIVCDEPVSALDVSIQAQVINLLADLKAEFDLSYIMIAHDLSVVNHVSDRIMVMYLGKIIEEAATSDLLAAPKHPYTKALISAIPAMDPDRVKERIILKGELPSPADPPSGCRFHPRCWKAMDKCRTVTPEKVEISSGHTVSCHLY